MMSWEEMARKMMNRLLVVTLAAVVAIEILGCTAPVNAAKGPVITSISPSSIIAGGPGFTLTVNGSNFNGNSYVLWNGAQRPTVTINSTQLQALISSADTASAGTVQITVVDPKPFPHQSNPTSLTINSVSLTITTASLPTATVQQPYSAGISNSGGAAPYTWKIASGNLPPGLALDSTSGAINGAPGQAGKYAFTAQVSDSSSTPQTASQTLAVNVIATSLLIGTTTLPRGTVQVPYISTLTATGGTAPYSWSVVSGALPPGLVLNASTGTIAGTPSASGQYSFTVQVKDSAAQPQSATNAFSISIAAPAPAPSSLQITTSSLPGGQVQMSYSATLAGTGGTPPYSWSVVAGSLPPGLVLNASTGTIAGTPSASGQYSFTVQVKDSAAQPQSATKAFSISIAAPAPAPLQITTTSLLGGAVGVNYSATLVAANGVPPYTWSITGGQLPPGLTLQASTGQISGNPTQAGAFGFLVQAKDSSGQTASGNFSVNIAPASAPTITSVSPNSGNSGTSVTITGTGFTSGAVVSFGLTNAATTLISSTQLTAVVPSIAVGTYSVTVQEGSMPSATLPQAFTVTSVWNLIWSDEFNGTALDTTKWTAIEKAGAITYYTTRPQNLVLSGGTLALTALNDNYVTADGVTHPYTSGYIQSELKGDWTYGAFEIRAKLSPGLGMHPAIWMLPTDNIYGAWPNSGEIDIMEANPPDDFSVPTVFGTLHFTNGAPSVSYTLPSGNFSDSFHVFRLEWEPTEIRWYVDGNLYEAQSSWSATGAPYPAPFNQRFYLKLNLAMLTQPDSTTPFPNTLTVDYVRVY